MRKMKKVLYLTVTVVTLAFALGSVLLSGASPVSADSPPSLVGLWHLNGNTDDSSGTGNNGTFYGGTPSYSASPMGQALSFDGSQYVKVPDSSTLDVNQVTLEAWIKPVVSTQTGYARIIFKGTNSPFRPLYFLAYDVTGKYMRMVVYIGGTAASNAKEAVSTTMLTDTSKWYYIAGTYDGTNVKIYINGILEGTTAVPSDGNIDTGTQDIGIGRNPEGNVYGYRGLIDEVRVWNGALSSEQIRDNTVPVLTITAPSPIDFGKFLRTNEKCSSTDGTVTVTGFFSSWSVDAVAVQSDISHPLGHMMNGSTPLINELSISKDGTTWSPASTGINYTGTAVSDFLPLCASQIINPKDVAGDYTITIRYTGTLYP